MAASTKYLEINKGMREEKRTVILTATRPEYSVPIIRRPHCPTAHSTFMDAILKTARQR